MLDLIIPATKETLGIEFQSKRGELSFSGSSYPENAVHFFQPVFNWLKSYANDSSEPVMVNFEINYLNTSSTKCIIDVLDILEQYQAGGRQVTVKWFFKSGEEDIREMGEEFEEDSGLTFTMVEIP